MNIIIINGPNLNLLGKRETDIYGCESFLEYLKTLRERYATINIDYFQSNQEGEIIETLQHAGNSYSGVILNAAAYSHTSIAIADAVRHYRIPIIELHISNIYSRESFRHHSFISPHCKGAIAGFGLHSYTLATEALINHYTK